MNDIKEQFFKTFGIESKIIKCEVCGADKIALGLCAEVDCDNVKVYPKITAEILLELICIANKASIEVVGETVEEMKNKLLEEMIYWKDDIVHKEIQQLFKEEE